jgi:hypothetical protein
MFYLGFRPHTGFRHHLAPIPGAIWAEKTEWNSKEGRKECFDKLSSCSCFQSHRAKFIIGSKRLTERKDLNSMALHGKRTRWPFESFEKGQEIPFEDDEPHWPTRAGNERQPWGMEDTTTSLFSG